ncbi:dolichyl-phosphate-mannose--protein mannosyltransferase [Malassezia caprae]|uniref:Dolichyl-phosphate-mannose--protein mannosyltransferase n=1 Tax=Malassezia caprae TaxID=1381934 RepID=A0AAF0IWY7_9BASI|nr:dolichyl-phosphate-mannose--protein mannosyltransferase [Malassezia caprae]
MDRTRGSTMRARQAAPADTDARVESAADALSSAETEKLLQHPGPPARADPAWAPRAGPLLTRAELVVLVVVTLLAALVRFYHIERPSSVVFDEVHFGGFAAKYLQRKFFMDVHPPLAKLMITLAAWLHGFHGNFDFGEIGTEYLTTEGKEAVPYVAMRAVGAWFGTLTVPLAYLTLRGLRMRPASALLSSLLVLFDNALTTQSRLILLDAPLVFFVAAALCAWVYFAQLDQRAPFSRAWWVLLGLTGLSLGLVLSCKWVGLFTVASVGVAVVVQLWYHLGNLRVPLPTLARHFGARAVCLIVLPLAVYMSIFAVHFAILVRAGSGDSFMGWPFRHTLRGNGMADQFVDVALGATVRVQHYHTLGGYLHSHDHRYETGSQQQQVTLYPFRDENNEWILLRAPISEEEKFEVGPDGHAITPDDEVTRFFQNLTYVKHGDTVRLLHKTTQVRLHSHGDHRPPVSEADYQHEVTGYGFPQSKFGGDVNDNWILEIHEQQYGVRARDKKRLLTLRTIFRLKHAIQQCYLFSHTVSLPDWGFGQQEVTCNSSPTLPNSLWYIETNAHPLLTERAHKVNYVLPGFFAKFLELHKAMWTVNRGLTAHHAYESRPQTWPILRRGINFWTKHHRQIYLIGNPAVWWSATVAVLLYALARAVLMLRAQRGYSDFTHSTVVQYDRACGFLAAAYALHFLPFFLMKRQLFLHHYLPALYISVLLLGVVFDLGTSRVRPMVRLYAALLLGALAGVVFLRYAPLSYASRWTNDKCGDAILTRHWDFNCIDFPEDAGEYATYAHVVNRPGDEQPRDDDVWPFSLPSLPDVLHRKVIPDLHRAQSTDEGARQSHADLVRNRTAEAVPNVSGMDQAQRQQAVLQGTSALRKADTTSTSSTPPGA